MAMFVGLGIFTLMAATGVAVDMSRVQSVHAKLANALDAAGLAAGAKVHSSDTQAVVENYVRANFPAGYLAAEVTDVNVVISEDNLILDLSATAEVDMTFMRIFGQESQTVSANSQITRKNRGLELVMVLDVTGSMYGSKISDLRTAATDMVNILFGAQSDVDKLHVGLVPYTTTVNIGNHNTAWLRDYDLSRYPPNYPNWATKWKGCVEARGQNPDLNGLDTSDALPDSSDPDTLFPMFFWESNWDNEWIDPDDGDVELNQNDGYSDGGAKGPNIGCGDEVTPFTSNKSTIQGAIDNLNPWRRGGTMSSIGLAWGWRMISPAWRGMWNHSSAELPFDYDKPLFEKAVIIMTDGVNEVFSPHSNPPFNSDYTGYRRIGEERLGNGINTRSEGVTAVNSRFTALCNAMKQQDIKIYAITFRLNNSTAANNARTMFRNCATHPDYYFDSPDGSELRQAFRQIGDSLANLMISR